MEQPAMGSRVDSRPMHWGSFVGKFRRPNWFRSWLCERRQAQCLATPCAELPCVCVADVTDDTATRPRFDDSLPARLSCRVGQQRPLTASKDATFKCHCDRAEHDCRQGNGASCGRHVALAAAGCFMRRSMVHNALRRARQLPTSRGVALGLLNGATARPVALGLPGALVAAARPLLQRCGPGGAGWTCDVHEDVSHMRGRRPVLSLDAGARDRRERAHQGGINPLKSHQSHPKCFPRRTWEPESAQTPSKPRF